MSPTRTAAAAWVVAAAVVAAMVALSGPVRAVSVVVLVIAQVGLQVLATRASGPSSCRRVAGLWSVEAGVTWLVAGAPTTTSALVYAVTGLVFALLAEVVLRLVGRFVRDDEEVDAEVGPVRTDTAPLPVHDGGEG